MEDKDRCLSTHIPKNLFPFILVKNGSVLFNLTTNN